MALEVMQPTSLSRQGPLDTPHGNPLMQIPQHQRVPSFGKVEAPEEQNVQQGQAQGGDVAGGVRPEADHPATRLGALQSAKSAFGLSQEHLRRMANAATGGYAESPSAGTKQFEAEEEEEEITDDLKETLEDELDGKVDSAFGSLFATDNVDLESAPYNVENLYHETGWCQAIARNSSFATLTLIMVFLNAVTLGIESDHNDADLVYESHPCFIVVDNIFGIFFALEWCVRFGAFAHKRDCLRDGWFRFDTMLVLSMVLDIWV